MKHKTEELDGALLDAAVAQALGDANNWPVSYSTDWSEAGPIIDRERIGVAWFGTVWRACAWNAARDRAFDYEGSTALVAAMRAYVASNLGDEVELP